MPVNSLTIIKALIMNARGLAKKIHEDDRVDNEEFVILDLGLFIGFEAMSRLVELEATYKELQELIEKKLN